MVAGGGPSPSFPREPLAARSPQRAVIGRSPGRWGAGAGAVLLLFRRAAPRLLRPAAIHGRAAMPVSSAGARERGAGWERDGGWGRRGPLLALLIFH